MASRSADARRFHELCPTEHTDSDRHKRGWKADRQGRFKATLYNRAELPVASARAPDGDEGLLPLLEFCSVPRSREEIASFIGVKTVLHAVEHYIKPLLPAGRIRMTIPEKPKSKLQRYVRNGRQVALGWDSPLGPGVENCISQRI